VKLLLPPPLQDPGVPTAHPKTAFVFTLIRQGKLQEALDQLADYPKVWAEADAGDGATLLHWCAYYGHPPLVARALKAGTPVDATTRPAQQTALLWCASKGYRDAATVLLNAKADLHAKDSLGATPAMIAVQHGHSSLLLLLLCRGGKAVLQDLDSKGCGLVHWAAYKGNLGVLKILAHFGADFTALDYEQKTPLHRAVGASCTGVLAFLAEQRADLLHRDKAGQTCWDLALEREPRVQRALARLLEAHTGQAPAYPTDGTAASGDLEAGQKTDAVVTLAMKQDMYELLRLMLQPINLLAPPAPREERERDDFSRLICYVPVAAWLMAMSFTVFQYLIDLRTADCWTIAPYTSMAFEVGAIVLFVCFVQLLRLEPGRVPVRTEKAGIEAAVRAIEAKEDVDLCLQTWAIKPPRTEYCAHIHQCVAELDHFSGWLNRAIGAGNHRTYVCFVLADVVTQCCHSVLCFRVVMHLVAWTGDPFQWALHVLTTYPLMAVVGPMHVCSMFYVLLLLEKQVGLINSNFTVQDAIRGTTKVFVQEVETKTGRKEYLVHDKVSEYDKGGMLSNCADFWGARLRSVHKLTILKQMASRKNPAANV